jgi:DNA primase
MPRGFSPPLLEEVRARTDLVELVGQFVHLRRAGENWKGLCPFHAEKTPSFTVNPRKGIFYCFGCRVGGDAFAFLMRHDRMGFPDAVKALADRAGVPLPEASATDGESRLDALRRVMALAATFYTEALWGPLGARARSYLESRGIDPDVARRFGLGLAPEGWDNLLSFMRREGVADETLLQVGLVLARQTGAGFYDRFRGRLLFPIRDVQGRVVAFGGRALAGEEPKYLNSPETSLYVKGQALYALDLARSAMRERNRAVIVEGYVDCLMAHQHGFGETVATLGTAFTPAQLGLLRRQVEEVITVFDADAAGQKASARVEEMVADGMGLPGMGWSVARTGAFAQAAYFSVKVAVLPSGHDPDSLLRGAGADAFRACLDGARSIFGFVMAQALAEEDLRTDRGRARAHARAALILSKVPGAEEASAVARLAARDLGVDATQLWIEAQQLQRAPLDRRVPQPAEPAPAAWPPPSLAERDLLALLLLSPQARASLLPCLDEEAIAHPGLRALHAALRGDPDAAPEALMAQVAGEAERSLLAELLLDERSWPDLPAQILELQRRYEVRRRKRQIREVTHAIARAQASGDPTLDALQAELEHLQREARAVRDLVVARPVVEPPR